MNPSKNINNKVKAVCLKPLLHRANCVNVSLQLQRHLQTILWVLRKVILKFEGKRHCSAIKLIISILGLEQLDTIKYKKLEKIAGSQRTMLRYVMWRHKHKLANRFQKELRYNFVILLLQKTQHHIMGYIRLFYMRLQFRGQDITGNITKFSSNNYI